METRIQAFGERYFDAVFLGVIVVVVGPVFVLGALALSPLALVGWAWDRCVLKDSK